MSVGRWMSRAATGLLGCLALSTLTLPVAQSDVAGHLATHTATRRDDAQDSPLRISIERLSPGVLPRHGPLVVTGTVRNTDDVAWTQVNLYPYLDTDQCVSAGSCSPPMTTAAALVAGAATDPASPVGVRITDPKQEIASIAPAQTVAFTLTIPQKVLRQRIASPQAGVYWFGVQAIGQSSDSPRDLLADGRARTFLPYLPQRYVGNGTGRSPLDTAVVVPIRAAIAHQSNGRLSDPADWLAALRSGGPLARALAIGRAAQGRPMSWLVDPAVVDAVQQLAQGNPERLLPAPGASASASPSATGLGGGTSGSGSAGPLAAAASGWLTTAHVALGSGQLLALPYGDPALVDSGFTHQLYGWARAQSGLLAGWRIPSRRAIASPDGYVDPAGLAAADDTSVVLLGEPMLRRPVAAGTVGSHPFVATSTSAAAGGPDPEQPFSSIAVRQRILAEAAVRLISGDDRALVVPLPERMGAGSAGRFWAALDQPWLHLTTLSAVLAQGDAAVQPSTLAFPASHAARPGQLVAQSEAQQLVQRAQLLQSIIATPHAKDGSTTANAQMASAVTGEALAATSYSRAGDVDAANDLAASRQWIDTQLAGVTISAPPSVTLSSAEGSFAVTVANSLDVPLTVSVIADASGARIDKPDPVDLAPHSRASVRLDAHTSRAGVHNLQLSLTDTAGTPIGASVTVPIRSGSVGVVIWAILATGTGILFIAIAIRLYRRLRRPRRQRAESTP